MLRFIFVYYFLIGIFMNVVFSSTLKVFDNYDYSTNLTFSVNSPAFSLGSTNFPVFGRVILTKGCSGFSKIDKLEVEKEIIKYNTSNFIVLLDFDSSDASCFYWINPIFDCQTYDWCKGIMIKTNPNLYLIAGQLTWSSFDAYRSRDSYKVPLVEVSPVDFDLIKEKVIEYSKTNFSCVITLNSDPNPWEEMYMSDGFLLFRIINGIFSVGCFFLSVTFLFQFLNKNETKAINNSSINLRSNLMSRVSSKIQLKSFCLGLQVISHISRVAYFAIDPFWSQRIYTYLISWELSECSSTFQIGSNILTAFIMRELTHSVRIADMRKKILASTAFIFVFWIGDFTTATLAGLVITSSNTICLI